MNSLKTSLAHSLPGGQPAAWADGWSPRHRHFQVAMPERLVGLLASFPLPLESAFLSDDLPLGLCRCASSPARDGSLGKQPRLLHLRIASVSQAFILVKTPIEILHGWAVMMLHSWNLSVRKWYHGIRSVLREYAAGVMNVGGRGIGKGQESLLSKYSPAWRNVGYSQKMRNLVTRLFYQHLGIFLEQQSSHHFLQGGYSKGKHKVVPSGSLSLQPSFHKADTMDERWSYSGTLSVNIWQLSCLRIIFLIRTIGKIHQDGRKGVRWNEYMTLLFVKFGKQKNNKYFKW